MAADAFPLDNAVNNAEEKILHPENRNTYMEIPAIKLRKR